MHKGVVFAKGKARVNGMQHLFPMEKRCTNNTKQSLYYTARIFPLGKRSTMDMRQRILLWQQVFAMGKRGAIYTEPSL
jgi:hypothetical protein